MDKHQKNDQASIIEMEGKLHNQIVAFLIDPGSNYNYISPNIVEKCNLVKELHEEPWLVQLATRAKRIINH